jgi:hypothetical protein
MLFAYDRLARLIEGEPGERPPASLTELRAALIECAPTYAELTFLRRLARARNAGAALAVVCTYTPDLIVVRAPMLLEAHLDDDDAHNRRAATNCARLAAAFRERGAMPTHPLAERARDNVPCLDTS